MQSMSYFWLNYAHANFLAEAHQFLLGRDGCCAEWLLSSLSFLRTMGTQWDGRTLKKRPVIFSGAYLTGLLKWSCPKLLAASHSICQKSFFSFLWEAETRHTTQPSLYHPLLSGFPFGRVEGRGEHRRSSFMGAVDLPCLREPLVPLYTIRSSFHWSSCGLRGMG